MAITRRRFIASGAASVAWVACDPGTGPPPSADDWDVCVIGSGFAGILLAQRTAERGLRTLVVEAGGPGAPGAAERFGYTNSGPIDYPVNSTRMIAIGGASGHWTGLVNRLRPVDFRVRSEFGQGADWPLDYAELAPWYCRAERALGVAGHSALPGAEPPRNCAYPESRPGTYRAPEIALGGRNLRFFEVPLALRDGAPLRLDRSEVPAFEASPNGTLLSGHQALRLVAGDEDRIDHVLVQGPGQEPRRIRARVFVVAAGVIESARLLLLSRSPRHPNGLGNARDLVGRYLVEHVTVNWRGVARPPRELPPGLHRSYDLHDSFRRENLNACHVQLFADEPRPDGTQPVFWKLQPEMQSRPENRVSLSGNQRDPWGSAAPDVHMAYSERDRRTIERGTTLLRDELRAAGLRPDAPARSATWRAHPAGTCRMGFAAEGGVVDRNHRVFGADNVYVSGACVFPTSGTANPTLTVVALTLRLAEHLVESLA
jgi:choline dehydrogenase-like flavoprotein